MKRFLAELQRTRPQLEKVLRIKSIDISNDMIKSSSIKFKKDNEEEWSQACKYTLIALQGMCHVSKLADKEN